MPPRNKLERLIDERQRLVHYINDHGSDWERWKKEQVAKARKKLQRIDDQLSALPFGFDRSK